MNASAISATAVLSTLLLTACTEESGPEAFTSFGAAPEDGTVTISGSARTAAFDDVSNVVSISQVAYDDSAFLDITYETGAVTRVEIADTAANIDLNADAGASFNDAGALVVGRSADGRTLVLMADPDTTGFDYQTYSLWLTGYGTSAGEIGAGSFGAATDAAAIPSFGSATYAGTATGLASDGIEYLGTISNVQVTADFGSGTASVTSSGTELFELDTLANAGAQAGLDFIGSGPISGATFDASVGGSLTVGNVDGEFYGPGAEEVGGTFATSGSGITHVGSFGAD